MKNKAIAEAQNKGASLQDIFGLDLSGNRLSSGADRKGSKRAAWVLGSTMVLCGGIIASAFDVGPVQWMDHLGKAAAREQVAVELSILAKTLPLGIGAANAKAKADENWKRLFGNAEFAKDPMGEFSYVLSLAGDAVSCDQLRLSAESVSGLAAIDSGSRRIWSQNDGTLQSCPKKQEGLVLLFSLKDLKR